MNVVPHFADEVFRVFPEIKGMCSEGDEQLPYVLMANLVAFHVQSVASSKRRLCHRMVSGSPNHDGPTILHRLRHLDRYPVDVSWFAYRRSDRASKNWAMVVLSHIRCHDRSVTWSTLFTPDKLRPPCRR
jgi:hypothetical protein